MVNKDEYRNATYHKQIAQPRVQSIWLLVPFVIGPGTPWLRKYSSNRYLKTARGPFTVSAQRCSKTDLQPSQLASTCTTVSLRCLKNCICCASQNGLNFDWPFLCLSAVTRQHLSIWLTNHLLAYSVICDFALCFANCRPKYCEYTRNDIHGNRRYGLAFSHRDQSYQANTT